MIHELDKKIKQNTLFSQSEASKLQLKPLYIIIVYFLLWIIGLFIGRCITNLVLLSLADKLLIDNSIIFAIRKFITCGTQISLFFIWIRLFEKRKIKTLGFVASKPLKLYITGMLIGFMAITGIVAILVLTNTVKINNINFLPLNLAVIAVGWMIQSASEEIAIRGWLIPVLGNRSTPLTAILITSIIFGILHLFSSGVTVLSFTNLVLSGAFFAEYAIYSNNIWGVCGMHFSWNMTLGNIFGFSVSGFSDNVETVFRTKPIGASYLTGGDFGPEGGFITTVILFVGICILTLMLINKYKSRNFIKAE